METPTKVLSSDTLKNVKIEVINTLDEFMYAVINYLQY